MDSALTLEIFEPLDDVIRAFAAAILQRGPQFETTWEIANRVCDTFLPQQCSCDSV
jgi:hypothetical protein